MAAQHGEILPEPAGVFPRYLPPEAEAEGKPAAKPKKDKPAKDKAAKDQA